MRYPRSKEKEFSAWVVSCFDYYFKRRWLAWDQVKPAWTTKELLTLAEIENIRKETIESLTDHRLVVERIQSERGRACS